MVTRLLDAADKVPSFCLEQEPTPGGSSLRGLRAAGPAVREQPLQPRLPPRTPHRPAQGSRGSLSVRHLLGRPPPEGPPFPDFTPPPGLGGQSRPIPGPRSGLQGPYLGNHLACSVRGHPLAPSSADPRGRRSTSLGLAALGGAWMLALPTPGPSVPPGAPSPTR